MSVLKWTALLALLLSLAAQAETPQRTYEMEAKGEIAVGPDGSVHDYRLRSDLAPEIAAIIDRHVRSWKFEPILVDGKPVIGETAMHLSLSAVPKGEEQYVLKVDNVWFGQPERAHAMEPPRYPMSAARRGLGAKVVLVLKLDAGGNVVDILPEQTSLTSNASERAAERWRELFEKASIAAAREWKFDTTEKINGKPVGSLIRVPVTFTMQDSQARSSDGQWQAFVPGPVRPIPWVTPEALASQRDRDALEDGEAQPLDSRFKLKTEVIGTTL